MWVPGESRVGGDTSEGPAMGTGSAPCVPYIVREGGGLGGSNLLEGSEQFAGNKQHSHNRNQPYVKLPNSKETRETPAKSPSPAVRHPPIQVSAK